MVGGTSAASPSFAGVMALVVENTAARQGNANVAFYSLASRQRPCGASVFHDIIIGNNSVPGQAGFKATTGYDQATGLGSIDASVLVNHWGDATATPAFHATVSAISISVTDGSNKSATLNVTVSGGFNAGLRSRSPDYQRSLCCFHSRQAACSWIRQQCAQAHSERNR